MPEVLGVVLCNELALQLGFFLDNKLSYKTHVQTKVAVAQQVFQRLQRLGNTQRGLCNDAGK
jgi:hypothetical protein